MVRKIIAGTFALAIVLPLGCRSGERSVTFSGPVHRTKLAVETDRKADDDRHIVIVDDD